jgi:hypothetical protein
MHELGVLEEFLKRSHQESRRAIKGLIEEQYIVLIKHIHLNMFRDTLELRLEGPSDHG